MRDLRSLCKYFFLVLAVLISNPGGVFAQRQQWTGDLQLMTYMGIGENELELNSLNETMNSLQLPEFSQKPFSLELGAQLIAQQLVLESGLNGLFWRTRVKANTEGSLIGGYGHFDLGVNFTMPGSSWKIYPFFSIGAGVLRLSYHPMTLEFTGGNKSLTSEVYWLPTVVTGFGGALMHTFHIESKKKLLTIGIKGGVLVDPTRHDTWYRHGTAFKNGPAPQFTGPFLQLIIGNGHYITG